MNKYGSWKIYDKTAAFRNIEVKLVDDEDVFASGCYGKILQQHDTAIAGVCLFDANLCVKFETGAIRTVARGGDRKHVGERIQNKGIEVIEVIFPTQLSTYHKDCINFLAKTVKEFGTDRLLYHIPVDEYKIYMSDLENLIGKSISGANDIVEVFAENIKQYFIAKMQEVGFDNFEFIRPMRLGAKTPEESYSFPYVKPELFGAMKHNIYAIEDLVELTITMMANEICGCNVPVKFYVLDVPHPYMVYSKKNVMDREDVIIISV